MSPLPQLLPHTRARARAEVRYWRAVLVCWGYHIRPFDMLADRRHWRWQKPSPCGRQKWAALTSAERAAIAAALQHRHDQTGGDR